MRKSGLTGDEAYALSKRRKTTEDLGPLKKELGQLKEDLSNKITKFYASNQGETYITDSDNGKIQDMMLYGISSQDGTPTPENPVEIKSVVNPTMKVYGKNFYSGSDLIGLTKTYTTDFIPVALHKGALYISFDTFSDTSNGQYHIIARYFDKNKEQVGSDGRAGVIGNNISHVETKFDGTNAGNNHEAVNLQNVLYVKITLGFYAATATEITYKNIMVSATDFDFEPYKPAQIVTLPYTLNAIPVASGSNVTINGQQYVADYVDVERGKMIRMCKEKVFDGTEKWRSESSYMVADIPNFSYVDNNNHEHMTYLLCNKYKVSTTIGNNDNLIFVRINGDGVVIKDTLHQSTVDDWKKYLNDNPCIVHCLSAIPEEIDLTTEEIIAFKALVTYYPVTNISINSEQLDGYTVFNYPISMANGWNYVKQQLNDNRDYIYDMDAQSAEAYVNSEYAVALTELEV